ncbi:MAG: N-acetyltransferase family protein, partial [Tumebacillaceae bacterium]
MSDELVIMEVAEISPEDVESLSRLLVDVVADGASIGFLPPLSMEEAQQYWSQLPAPDVRMWVARLRGEIVGS